MGGIRERLVTLGDFAAGKFKSNLKQIHTETEQKTKHQLYTEAAFKKYSKENPQTTQYKNAELLKTPKKLTVLDGEIEITANRLITDVDSTHMIILYNGQKYYLGFGFLTSSEFFYPLGETMKKNSFVANEKWVESKKNNETTLEYVKYISNKCNINMNKTLTLFEELKQKIIVEKCDTKDLSNEYAAILKAINGKPFLSQETTQYLAPVNLLVPKTLENHLFQKLNPETAENLRLHLHNNYKEYNELFQDYMKNKGPVTYPFNPKTDLKDIY